MLIINRRIYSPRDCTSGLAMGSHEVSCLRHWIIDMTLVVQQQLKPEQKLG